MMTLSISLSIEMMRAQSGNSVGLGDKGEIGRGTFFLLES